MAASATSWSPTAVENNADIANHLSSLSVDETAYTTSQRQAIGVGVPTSAASYGGVQRAPSFGPYDGQYMYYANGGPVDPSAFSPNPNGSVSQPAFSYAELAAGFQSLGPAAGVAFDPYPRPSDTFSPHSPDARASAAALAAAASNTVAPLDVNNFLQQQQSLVVARNQLLYRSPHFQGQVQNSAQHPYFATYGDRAQLWNHTNQNSGGGRDGGRHHTKNVQSQPPRRASHHQQASQAHNNPHHTHHFSLTDFTHASSFIPPSSLSAAAATFSAASPAALQYTLGHAGAFGAYTPAGHFPYLPRQNSVRRNDEGTTRSQRLEDFRQKKSNRMELSEIYGHICEFAGDQHGSRFIQNKLEAATPEERAKIFEEIMPNAYQLMTDVFGNYVIQKLFEHGDQQQKAALAKKMEGHVLQLSMQMYGCRVMQKALEHVLVDQREKLVSELQGYIIECVKSSNANHVIQRLISLDPPASVTDAFVGHVQELSTHPYGCRVLQKSFEVLHPDKIRTLLDEMHTCSVKLMVDQFGNYVVQSVLTDAPGHEYDRDKVVNEIKSRVFDRKHYPTGDFMLNLGTVSRHKFASNVVEKAIKNARSEDRRALIAEMMDDDGAENRIGTLLRDAFGNFPVQTALAEADADQRDKLLTIIIPLMPNLRHTPCGRRLEAKIADYESKGILPSLTNSLSTTSNNSPNLSSVASDSEADAAEVVATGLMAPAAYHSHTPQSKGKGSNNLRRIVSSPDSQDEAQVLKDLLA